MEVHRISEATAYRTDAFGFKYTSSAPGPYYVAFTEPESWSGREYDGRRGLTAWNLTYCVPPCNDLEDLETHIALAATDDPSINDELPRQARRAGEFERTDQGIQRPPGCLGFVSRLPLLGRSSRRFPLSPRGHSQGSVFSRSWPRGPSPSQFAPVTR